VNYKLEKQRMAMQNKDLLPVFYDTLPAKALHEKFIRMTLPCRISVLNNNPVFRHFEVS
jgi:hypothetical protein